MAFFIILWLFIRLSLSLDCSPLLDGLPKNILVVHGCFLRSFRGEVKRRSVVVRRRVLALDEVFDVFALFNLLCTILAQSGQKAAAHVVIASGIFRGLGGLCVVGGFGNGICDFAQIVLPVILGLLASFLLGRHFYVSEFVGCRR